MRSEGHTVILSDVGTLSDGTARNVSQGTGEDGVELELHILGVAKS